VLSIYSKETDAFDDEELTLLQELSEDLAFGVLTHRSNAERRRAEARVERLTNFDPVTALPNRGRLVTHLEEAVGQARLQESSMALMTIGLDRFSDIQEGVGITGADEVMKHVAQRLKEVVGDGNFLARASAESFAVVIPIADTERAHDIAIKVQLAMNEPLEYAGIPLVVQATNGVALFPEHGDDAAALMRRSDIAIRQARAADTAYALYNGKGESESPQRLKLLAQLRQAIRNDELVLYSQPKIDVLSGTVVAVEALLRWPNPAGGMTPPGRFIPLAESTGLIKPITRWVLDAAWKQILRWQSLGLEVPVAINVSPANLRDPDFLDQLVALHARKSARLDLLQVEVTETALMTDPARAHVVLERIRDLGIQIYIDDFGTGYSSLSYIATLPIHALKIDRSFILGMMRHERHRAVVAASISLAHTLGLKVVAEGIETIDQARAVIDLGCDEIQGYLFSKPLPVDEFLVWNAAFNWERYGLHASTVP
jgi:diguanylate cyclase (GGDEF)-like protein